MCSKIVFTTQFKLIIVVLFGVFSHPTNGFWVDKPKWLKWPPNPPWVGGWYGGGRQSLNVGFYAFSCPQAEFIIQDVFRTAVRKDPGLPAALIRLYFHDCFVNGCDASILLDSTPSGGPTEKTSKGNIGVRGFEVIDEMKKQLEQHCPETVSCADIISFAARDSVTHSGIPYYHVPAGRRDGLTSNPTQVLENLPKPFFNVEQMSQIFTKKGMTQQDLVVLLGAHSIGVAHCYLFLNQFNHYNATHDINPNMDKIFAMNLKKICPIHNITNYNDVMPLNIYRNYKEKLSNIYYLNVINGRTVIPADHSLVDDPNTNYLVHVYANGLFKWVIDFREAMLKLGQVDVLTGTQGQIRRSCRFVN